jgi:hypothetical protein
MITPGVEVRWELLSPQAGKQPPERSFASMTTINDRFLLMYGGVGGPQGHERLLGDLWAYEIERAVWRELFVSRSGEICQAARPRSHHSSFFVSNKLYVFGGFEDGSGRRQCAQTILILDEIFLPGEMGFFDLNPEPAMREIPCDGPGIGAHSKAQVVLLPVASSSDGIVPPRREEVLVTYGGHDGTLLLDGLAFFSFEQERWLRPAGSAAPYFLLPGVHAGGPRDCGICGAAGSSCAHLSPACTSYGVAAKRLSASMSQAGGSLPPRCGHSLTLCSPTNYASPTDLSGAGRADAWLLMFGGEVGLCVSNSLFAVSLYARQGQVAASWEPLSCGTEYCRRRGLLPPLSRSQCEKDHSEKRRTTSSAQKALRTRQNCDAALLRMTESPPSGGRQRAADAHGSPQRRGDPLPPAAVPHTAFHCAWPSGSNGLVLFGGLNGATGTYAEEMLFFDTVRLRWHSVYSPSCPGACSPGCRVGASEATARRDTWPQGCRRCAAPQTERHYLFGGENRDGERTNQLFMFQLHSFGCGDASISPLGRAAPELTPPPRRSASSLITTIPDSRSLLPLKMFAALLLLDFDRTDRISNREPNVSRLLLEEDEADMRHS